MRNVLLQTFFSNIIFVQTFFFSISFSVFFLFGLNVATEIFYECVMYVKNYSCLNHFVYRFLNFIRLCRSWN